MQKLRDLRSHYSKIYFIKKPRVLSNLDSNIQAHAAMKVEPLMMNSNDEILKMEVFVLKKMQKSKHACRLFSAGRTSTFNYMIMSLLGK